MTLEFRLGCFAAEKSGEAIGKFIFPHLPIAFNYGEYDYIQELFHLPSNIDISSIDFHYFKYAYFVYIEPVLIGIKRYEYSSLLKNS